MKELLIKDEFQHTANVLHFHGQNINQLSNTFDLIYTKHKVNSDYDKDKLAIVSTWTEEEKCCLLQQCRRFDIPLINCVPSEYDTTQKWYMPNKIKFFIDVLKNTRQELVMFLDGYDVLLVHLDDIIQRFEKQKYRILFGPSCNNYPDTHVDTIYGRTRLGMYRYFNAGCCIGYREDLLKFYEEALAYIDSPNPWNSEQYVMRQAFAKYSCDVNQTFIGIDYQCIIFRSMGVTNSNFNVKTGEIHFNINRLVKQHIIVTGSDGFIGQVLVQRLRQIDPNSVIYEVDRKHGQEAKDIGFLFAMKDIDVVYHLAAQTSVFNENNEQIVKDNIDTFVTIVDLCNKYGTKLVYASSSTANTVNTTSLYGLSKRFDEEFANMYCPFATGVRLHNVYSENPREGTLAWHILHDDKIVLYNNGSNVRHFTYVDDAVTGLLYAYSCSHKLINCYNPTEMTTKEFTETICQQIGKTDIEYRIQTRDRDREAQLVSSSLPNVPIKYIELSSVKERFVLPKNNV